MHNSVLQLDDAHDGAVTAGHVFRGKVAVGFPLALLSQEKESQSTVEPPSSGPSEGELALQEALGTLQQEKDHIHAQYQAQVNTKKPHRFFLEKIS